MQQVKRTHAVRCPVCGKGRVIAVPQPTSGSGAPAPLRPGACGQGGAVLQMSKVRAADWHLLI